MENSKNLNLLFQINFDVEDDVFAILRNKKTIALFTRQLYNGSISSEWRFLLKGSLLLNGILSGSKTYGRESIQILKEQKKSD